MLLRALRGPSIAAMSLLLTGPLAAVPTQYSIYLDRDNNAATGCTVTIPSGSLSGVEEILQTTVNTTGPGSAVVDQVTQSICTAPPATFSAPVVIDAGDWPVGFANGVGGQNVTETYWPLPNPKPLFVRVVVVAQPQTGAPDEMAVTAPGGTTPIVIQLGSVIEVPTLSAWGAMGLAVLLFAAGFWMIRQKKQRRSAAVLLLVLATATAVYAATVVLDGQIGDWAPGTQVATDSAADGSLGSNMVALFAQVDNANDRLAFRIDGSLQFNQPPVANDQSPAAGNEDTAQNLTLTGSDGDGDPLTFSIVTPPTGGSLSALTNPTATSVDVTYTPNLNFNGADSFVFQVADGFGGTDTGTVTLAVTAVDDDPTAVNDAATVNEDSGANAIAVLANDTDPDAGPISITAVTQPANGVVVITGGGTGLTYQPNANTCNNPPGTTLDTFTYTLTPGGSTATVTMTVTCVDDPPTAVADAATVTEDDPATAIPVLANDTDLDGGPISITSVTQPANGTVVITGGGTGLTYQPAANYCNNPPGTTLDTFTYTLTPGGSAATVTMTVTCVDDGPVAVDDAASLTEDDPATAVNVLANDTDTDGGPISITSVTQPANGTVVITGGGTGLTYQPNANYCNNPPGTTLDTFTYTLTPGGDSATVSMTVTCVDDNPVAVNDAATVNEDSGANAVAVLANDTDIDAGPISITSVTQPANGTVVITGGGTGLTYAPNSNYCNNPPGTTPDTFTYTLTPGGSVATVSMTVTCLDDPPAAVADAATVNEDSGANAVAVLANDVDNDGGPISITSVTQPANGVVVITGGGTGLTYQPSANYCNNPPGTTLDTFTYTLTPGGSSATVTMTVTCLNDAPALDLDANDSGGTAGADFAVTFTEGAGPTLIEDPLDATVSDIDNANLASMTVTITNVQNLGSEILSADVTGTSIVANYVPATGVLTLTGPDTVANFQTVLRKVRYTHVSNAPTGAPARIVNFVANDGATNSNTATSTVTVVPVDTNPTAVADSATVAEDSGATAVNVLANDTDPDGGPISITSVTQPANGVVVITGGGTGLTYQPSANTCNNPPGTTLDTFTYTLTPGGSSATVTMTVTCLNDAPALDLDADDSGGTAGANYAVTFTEGDAPTLIEDPVDATVSDIDNANLASMTVTITNVQNVGSEILSADVTGTSITANYVPATGVLTLTGPDTVANFQTVLRKVRYSHVSNAPTGAPARMVNFVANDGATNSNTATSTVTVVPVDTNPTAVADAATVAEDSSATAVNVLANDTDPDGGPISITSVTQPANGTVVITGGGTGLTYQPNPNFCTPGPADTFTYTLTPGGSTATVSMTVTCVDDNPVAVADAATVLEDSGANAINVLANDTDADGGPISISSVTQPANGTVVITGGGTGLTYQPNANYCNNPPGTTLSTFTYTLTPGGSSTTVTVTVTCVDDNPVAVADSATVTEDDPATAINVLANDTDVDGGPISITSVTQPANGTVVITGGGTGLTYQPNANYCNNPPGTTLSTFTYTLTPGGSSTTVTVTVTCVDDPPTAVNDAATVNEDSGANAIPVLANDTDVDGGPISITSVTQPTNGTVVITGGGTGLTYQPNLNYCNNPPGTTLSTFTYTLTPGGSVATVTVTVTCVNDPPVADNDTFDFIGNTELRVDTGAVATPHALETTGTTFGVIDGDSDPVEGDAIAVSSITVGACTDNSAPFDCTDAAVGTVHMQTNGRFSFEPAPGDTGATETFTYVLTDNGVPAPASVTATVTLTRFERVWYVRNNATAGGLGRSFDPFDTLLEAQTASLANDYIFVYFGSGTTTGQDAGITLKNGQHLIGEHAGLSIPVNLNANGSPTSLVTAVPGDRPMLDDTTAGNPEGVAATDAIPTEIVGLNLAGNVNGIDLTTNAAFAGSGNLEVRDNVIRSSTLEGLDVNAAGTGTVNLSIHDNTITAGVNGVDVNRTAGTVRVTAFDDNVVTGNSGGIGMVLNNVIFDSTPGNPINAVLGGTTVIGASGNGVGTQGLILGNVTGELTFNDLDVFNDAGIGLGVTSTGALNAGAGTGFRVAVVSGVSTIDSNGGPGVSISNASVTLPLASYESTNSTTTGLNLVNAFGGVGSTAFGAGSGLISDPVGASGVAVNIDGGNGNITIGIPVTNNSGNAVSVSNRTGDTVSFAAAINETGSGLTHTTNSGATISYSGGITASTGANIAFNATGGGTIHVTGATNTLTTTTGTALNFVNTTIGASNLNFRSIASNGGANGIVLNNTGASGGLIVTGTGSAGSGGTIQNKTGAGIQLTQTRNVSLSWMIVQNGSDDAVRGDRVNGFTLANSTISNNGNALGEVGLDFGDGNVPAAGFVGAFGTVNVTSTALTGNYHQGALFRNRDVAGTNNLTLNFSGAGCSVTGNADNNNDDGILIEAAENANIVVSVTGCSFASNKGDHFQSAAVNAGEIDVTFSGNTLTGGHPTALGQGITINAATGVPGWSGRIDYLVSGNNINGAISNGVSVVLGTSSAAAVFDGRVQNNIIGTSGVALSCSTQAAGVYVDARGNGTHNSAVTGNVIRQCADRGILAEAGDGDSVLNLTVTGNTIDQQVDPLAREAIQTNFGITTTNVFGNVDSNTVCLQLGGAGALANVFSNGGGAPDDFRLRKRHEATVRLPGYGGGTGQDAASLAAVVAFVEGQNTDTPPNSAAASGAGGGYTGGAACTLPTP